jgi:hypothetical protein
MQVAVTNPSSDRDNQRPNGSAGPPEQQGDGKMAQHTNSLRIGAMTLFAVISLATLPGSAFAAAHGGGGGGHAAAPHGPAGHAEGGHPGFGHPGAFGHDRFHGGFDRDGHHYHYGPDGAVIEDFGYVPPPVVVAPPVLPFFAAPFGVFIR